MKSETQTWLSFADENLQSANVLLKSKLFNPCLQNVQQAVEKALKALVVEHSDKFIKTHSINELQSLLDALGLLIELSKDDCDFLDSIYLPSKYPLGSALPDFEPDHQLCEKSVLLAERVLEQAKQLLG